MTREEALENLKILKEDYCDDDGYGHETKQYDDTMLALDMAIKALEQEPCDDCVRRQEVLAIAGDSCLDLDSYEDTREFCDEIKELPPVTPQPKTGQWIDGVCSECGWDAGQEAFSEDANFCMKCGVKMLPIGAEKE